MIGIYIGYPVESSKTGSFLEVVTGDRLAKFEGYQHKSAELFQMFKTEFKKLFPETKPVTGRSNWQ